MTTRPALPDPGVDALAAAVAGLAVARDRLGEVVSMLERGSGCRDVVESLAEVSRAVDRAGFAVISTGLQECVRDPERTSVDLAVMEKLFLFFA